MVLFKFQVPSKFNILLLGYILYFLEGGIFVLFSSSIVLYINFLSQYSEFYYFALFFLHVPISWIALANYGLLVSIAVYYILFFDLNLFLYVKAFIFSGIIFTGLTLISGMLWGLPFWGVLFAFDARFILVLVLLIFYFVFLILLNLAQSGRFSYEFLAYFILIGSINLPLIKYSVDWWNTLHQSQSLTQVYSTIHFTIGTPLLFFNSLFALIYFYLLCRLILNVYIELKVKFFRKF